MAKANKQTYATDIVFGGLASAHRHFNRTLFGGTLPDVFLNAQRHHHSYGYFSGGRMVRAHGNGETEPTDEIAINPMHVAERSPEEVLSTLVHEMVHQWQHHHGKRPTRCYHDRQWAAKMKDVGLYPSHTGREGGKETGAKMTHYIVNGGPFSKSCAAFMKGNEVAFYQDRANALAALAKKAGAGEGEEGEGEEKKKVKGRVKFTCDGCKLNAWAKPSAVILCVPCKKILASDEATPEEDTDDDK